MFFYYLFLVPVFCAISIGLYWFDKRQAVAEKSRIPETTLLTIDALGGWPGGWWSQQRFRHKTQKLSYRLKFGLAVLCNLCLMYLLIRYF